MILCAFQFSMYFDYMSTKRFNMNSNELRHKNNDEFHWLVVVSKLIYMWHVYSHFLLRQLWMVIWRPSHGSNGWSPKAHCLLRQSSTSSSVAHPGQQGTWCKPVERRWLSQSINDSNNDNIALQTDALFINSKKPTAYLGTLQWQFLLYFTGIQSKPDK